MLHERGPNARELPLLGLPLAVDIGHADLRRPFDLGGEIGNGKAALVMHPELFRAVEDLGIDHDERGLRRVVLGRVHHDQAAGHAELGRGKADARRVVHGLEHVFDEPLKLGVHALDGLRLLAQKGVGKDENGSDGHLRG
jgi:hypothetical protein